MKYKHKVLAALAVTVMTIGLAVTASFFSFRHSQEASEARKNTYVVLQGANNFLNALLDAETGQRGYLLTGDKSFLEPYLDGSNSARGLLEKLRQDNLRDTSRVHLDKLALLVDARLADLSNVLELQHSRGMDAAREVVARGEGKRLMDSIRAETDSFIQVEEAALLHQDAVFHSNMRNLFILVVAAILLTLLLAITFAYFIYKKAWIRDGALQSAIFNSTNFSSIATDEKGVIQIFNVGAEHMLGYKAEDVVNKITPADISDPEEVIARATALSLELNTPIKPGFDALVFKASRGIEDIYEQTFIRKDGSRFPAVISVTALHDHLGIIIGYLLIGTDNTARKQVEASHLVLYRSLLDQQLYTRSLIESNIDAIITTDLRGIISDVNQQMQALTGCTREELIGAPFKNYFTDPERAEYAIASALREGKVINYELTAHARDGKETVVSYNANVFLDRERNMQGVLASARDVTDRKRLDQVLQESNVELENAKAIAEKANLAKSEFLSSMSHELRTPLNAVLGFAQLLASSKPPPTPAQKLPIDQILQAGWYLLRLINEILDLAMIESGKVMMSQEPMALADVFQECQAMIEPQAHERGIKITFAPLDIPYHVHADRTRVKQVIINLLSNAIKYNRDGGEVIVQCAMSGKNRVRVSVEDTGIGLAPEQLAQLFQPFNRLGQEAGSEEGSGIGLVVTKQFFFFFWGSIVF